MYFYHNARNHTGSFKNICWNHKRLKTDNPFYDLILGSFNLNRINAIDNRALMSGSISWKFSFDENQPLTS